MNLIKDTLFFASTIVFQYKIIINMGVLSTCASSDPSPTPSPLRAVWMSRLPLFQWERLCVHASCQAWLALKNLPNLYHHDDFCVSAKQLTQVSTIVTNDIKISGIMTKHGNDLQFGYTISTNIDHCV